MLNNHCDGLIERRGRTATLLLSALLAGVAVSGSACAQDRSPAEPAQATSALVESGDAPDLNAPPRVNPERAREVAPGLTIIDDPRIAFVPNIGIIEGTKAVLVVDTGLGPENGRRVLSLAREIAGDRMLYLTTTHFHPEHNFGASVFKDHATIIMNEAQADELKEKGPSYIDLFKTFGPQVADALEGTQFAEADSFYTGAMTLDLGGREIILREIPAHTRGDQMVYVPDVGALFTGDVAETRFFPIMPDADSSAERWVKVLRQLEGLKPEMVIPGHGAVADSAVLARLRLHIEFMSDRVKELVADGYDQQQITERLTPAIIALYPSWDNQVFIPFEIGILYGEATGRPPQLPEF
ncbi:MAG: MBL fold metallo-hydrolase [Xanthomonadales bacterium]|nr:MBL fold metallo-hydrolase [Xanthomonadales bacterium]